MSLPLRDISERREAARISVELPAHCRIGGRYVRDDIADLSRTGLYLKTREPAKQGTPVRVALSLPASDGVHFCTLVGEVARLDRDTRGILRGLGIRLRDGEIGAADRQALAQFLSGR